MQCLADEIASMQTMGVQNCRVINTIQLLLHITNRDKPIAIETPTVRDRFYIHCDLLEADGLFVGDVHACIGITRYQ